MRRAVDAVRAAGDDRDVVFDSPAARSAATCSTVGGCGPGSHDGGRTLRDLGEPGRPDHPQHQRRPASLPPADGGTIECGECEYRPFVVVRGDSRPPRRASSSRSAAAQSISRRATVCSRQAVVDQPRRMRSAASTGPTRVTRAASSAHGGSATRDR